MYKANLSAADQCVMCGMCQPYCPTYQADQIETESPRGRLAMILGLAQGQLTADRSIATHINHCTGCGACEAICPSRVPFMQLIDNSKYLLPQKSLVTKVILLLVRQPNRYSLLKALLTNQYLGSLLRLLGVLAKDSKNLQKTAQQHTSTGPLKHFYPARGEVKGNLGLFTGCITKLFDQATLNDSMLLLTHCGYNIHISGQQVCCGALHQHNGEIDSAQLLLKQNQQIFQTKSLDAVIVSATGCASQLKSKLNNILVIDIMQFINENKLLKQLQLQAIPSKVLVHEPCSQRNQLKLPSITPLISNIPGLKLNEMAQNQFCCGAGGINMLSAPASANKLRSVKIDDIHTQSADIVVTTNYGCALHLASGIDKRDGENEVEFCHPVSLLVRSASLQ